jgi:hypothetical protein
MSYAHLQGEGGPREAIASWLLALVAAVMLASTILIEWARLRGR